MSICTYRCVCTIFNYPVTGKQFPLEILELFTFRGFVPQFYEIQNIVLE
jgi:hypothetical protein